MDKREFLSALEKSLSVLQEDELRDIVSEYEQHIDIKVAKGLTEEEAIADFGSFSQLTAELLEAYHVRTDYAASGGMEDKAAAADGAPGAEERKHAVRAAAKGARLWLVGSVRWITCQAARPFSWFWKACRTYAENLKDRRTPKTEGEWRIEHCRLEETDTDVSDDSSTAGIDRPGRKGRGGGRRGFLTGGRVEESTQGQAQRRKKRTDMILHRIGEGIAGMFRWMTDVVCFAACMIWNGCWILFSVIMAGFGLFCLYGLGVLAVLLAQGYPLAGVTLGCLGLVMCAFSAAVIGFTCLKRRGNGVSENRRFKDSGRRWKKMMKEEDADSTGAAEGVGESGESGDEHPESGEEHGEDIGRTETEGIRENPIKRCHRRGGETTWVNYGV